MKTKLIVALLIALLLAGCAAERTPAAAASESLSGTDAETVSATEAETVSATDAETVSATEAANPSETEVHVTGEPLPAPEPASLDLEWDRVWRSEQEDVPGEGSLVRELVIGYDEHTFTYRCGEPYSEFFEWSCGPWELDGDELRLTILEAEEGWIPLEGMEARSAVYGAERSGDSLILTLRQGQGLFGDEAGVPVIYNLYIPEE